jgi:hypothetical protein
MTTTDALEPSQHPYHPYATTAARNRMHTRFWQEQRDHNGLSWEHMQRYDSVHRDGCSIPWIIKRARLADLADLERRRWAVLAEYRRVAAVRWAAFQSIEGDYASFLSLQTGHAPTFYVYRVDVRESGERTYVEGTWEGTWEGSDPPHGRAPVTGEVQPLVAYNLVRLYAKLARRGYWLGMLAEVLDRAILARLPDQKREAYGKSARVEINGRSYWYWWNGRMWVKQNWPEDDTIDLVIAAGAP